MRQSAESEELILGKSILRGTGWASVGQDRGEAWLLRVVWLICVGFQNGAEKWQIPAFNTQS